MVDRLLEIRETSLNYVTEAVAEIEERLSQIPVELKQSEARQAEHREIMERAETTIKALEITERFYQNRYTFEDQIKNAKVWYEHAYGVMNSARANIVELTQEEARLSEELQVLKRFAGE